MEIIAHRRNTLEALAETPPRYGIEVDIRSEGEQLIIHHDPFLSGACFEEWITTYCHGTLILNVKEEGLEDRLLDLMARYEITRFFFLDQSFPSTIKLARCGIRNCAIRFSEYESINTVFSLKNKVDWVWVDCFSGAPMPPSLLKAIRSEGFRTCLVSPELQGYETTLIDDFRRFYKLGGVEIDAVCTKRPDLWE